MKTEVNQQFKERVYSYLWGHLNKNEINQLWAEAIADGEKLDYLKTVANLKIYGKRHKSFGKADNSTATKFDNSLLQFHHYMVAAFIALFIGVIAFIYLPVQYGVGSSGKNIAPINSAEMDYYRSTTDKELAIDETMNQVIDQYNSGQTEQALALINKKLEEASLSERSQLILKMQLGKMYFNETSYDKAAELFVQIVNKSEDFIIKEKAMWLLANSYLKQSQKNTKNAIEILQQVTTMEGAHSRMAQTMLEKLQ